MTTATRSNIESTGASTMDSAVLWNRFKKHFCDCPQIGLSLDISRMMFDDDFLDKMSGPMERAFGQMAALERGEIANPDENRMVGHYWLRDASIAPNDTIRAAVNHTLKEIREFTRSVHAGQIIAPGGETFTDIIVVGIGGSTLGPQFVTDALSDFDDKLAAHFCDNTDPDGIDRTIARLGDRLRSTLTIVISKSGGTAETRNGMLEIKSAYAKEGVPFEKCAVAVTQDGSKLDRIAVNDHWIKRFPMWDWVGGRTSELSAVGLLPAALQGFDIDGMLDGARRCDAITRQTNVESNPAALLALMWYHAGKGRGQKDMVILPYKDRLALLSRYLQQLVMESLGKRLDLDGHEVRQGIAVYGNKGSTDQHAYVQQLRDGLNNFFATFVNVLKDRNGLSMDVEEGITSGDFLHGFLVGTRRALFEADRESITITVDDVSAETVGVLIALFERAVGLYASLINVNAYHQPGVEAGKTASARVTSIKRELMAAVSRDPQVLETADGWADRIDAADDAETVYHILEHLAANADTTVKRKDGGSPFESQYGIG
jgi:glucose-6-phosphate isomerase